MHVCSPGRIVALGLLLLVSACHSRGGIIHRVESGESLTLIAHVYEVPLKELLYANPRVKSDELRLGENILVPGVRNKRSTTSVVWDLDEVKRETQEEPEEGEEIQEKTTEPPASNVVDQPRLSSNVPSKSRTVKVSPKKALGFSWPASGTLISKFGMRSRKMHNGIDIRLTPQAEIVAAADGKVVYVGTDVEGYGNLLIMRHPTNLFSVYAYVGVILAKKDDPVTRGTVIAKANPKASEAFLHFELRRGKHALDPLQVLPK